MTASTSSSSKKIAFLFPGQGAQSVGMGQSFFEASEKARCVYETFDRIVTTPLNLSQVCFEGPEAELKRTLYTQPAILATSLAALQVFCEQSSQAIKPHVTAGHSLGEYGALYASGAIDLEMAATLIQKRAELMENASEGAMSAVLGLSQTVVEKVLQEYACEGRALVTVANYNTENQQVISGEPQAVADAGEKLKAEGAKRVIPLVVGGAFHSSLMDSAAKEFSEFLAPFEFKNAQLPVITNVDAKATTEGLALRQKLGQQINQSVYWAQTMDVLFNEMAINTVIEFGPGKVLTGMIRKAYKEVEIFNVYDLPSLEATLSHWNGVKTTA